MKIEDRHIAEAENILINKNSFNSERKDFIKNLGSCDLLAVPGSGKTTALLAKLYCISKQMPFNDGSGVLILSHTNAAVNEINEKLRPYCPKIFEYPNYVDTIQGFVNRFLANQACFEMYGSYIRINDDDRVYDKMVRRIRRNYTLQLYFNNYRSPLLDVVKTIECKDDYFIVQGRKLRFTSESGKILKEIWDDIQCNGEIRFNDSYRLANTFLDKYPRLKRILKYRFQYVFIDEMQDLEKFQIDILDRIFFEESSSSVMQRIGDINQSIYSSGTKVKVDADWRPRKPVYIRGSNRLTQENACLVDCFTYDKQEDENGSPRFIVKGERVLSTVIKPHMILFDTRTKGKLIGEFKRLIKQYSLDKCSESKYGFKIIGWNASWNGRENDNTDLRLEDIFPDYKKENSKAKETYDSLNKYIHYFDHKKKTLEASRKAILNALIHILRIEGKVHIVCIRGKQAIKSFTKAEMINFIKTEESRCDYELFKEFLYQCSYNLAVHKKYKETFLWIGEFVKSDFKTWFNLEISTEILEFIGVYTNLSCKDDIDSARKNGSYSDDVKIEIGTVHSVKGQTHCATMYVETAYSKPKYETNKLLVQCNKSTVEFLPNPLTKHNHAYRKGKDIRAKETLKIMYVGFSRPTHLLCFACLKENVSNMVAECESADWVIQDLTE